MNIRVISKFIRLLTLRLLYPSEVTPCSVSEPGAVDRVGREVRRSQDHWELDRIQTSQLTTTRYAHEPSRATPLPKRKAVNKTLD